MAVAAPVIVAVRVHGNAPVCVIGHGHGWVRVHVHVNGDGSGHDHGHVNGHGSQGVATGRADTVCRIPRRVKNCRTARTLRTMSLPPKSPCLPL